MNREQKAAVIDEIAAEISASQAIFAVDYRGISVAQADQLRANLRQADAVFRVVKNSLTERAAKQAGAEALMELLQGPTALTFVRGDAAAAAKAVADFTRVTQLLAFKGGLMDGAALSSGDVAAISRLPSREVLYGQLVGLIANPLSGLARTLNALIGGLAVGLGGVLAKKESDPAFAAPPSPAADRAEASGEAPAAEQTLAEAVAAQAPVAQDEPLKDTGDAAAAGEEAVAQQAPAAEQTFAEAVAAQAPVVQDEPVKDSGDALAQAPKTEAEAAPAAEGETEGAAPEAPSGDDDKEDQ